MAGDIENMIDRVFSDLPRPRAKDLRAFEGTEEKEDTAPFEGRDWQDIDSDTISEHYYALYWFTPQAFLYYLPAFLRVGVNSPKAIHVIKILQLLQPVEDPTLAQFRRERWQLLTDDQNRALEAWLSSLEAQARPGQKSEFSDAIRVVRERYWSK